jgi:hypothetical protein
VLEFRLQPALLSDQSSDCKQSTSNNHAKAQSRKEVHASRSFSGESQLDGDTKFTFSFASLREPFSLTVYARKELPLVTFFSVETEQTGRLWTGKSRLAF